MRAVLLLLAIPIILWAAQTALLRSAGLPIRWRLSARDLPRFLKRLNRWMTQAVFAGVLLVYPLLRGESPSAYYARFFPLDGRPRELLAGVAAAVLYLALLYLAWTLTDNVRFGVRHDAGRLARRLSGVPLTAFGIAFAEELLFRAVLLEDLLGWLDVWFAVAGGAAIFAAAHYVREVKRRWTIAGHVALGLLLCVAFVETRALWLPIGLHAGGVLLIMGARPFIRYTGPRWLVGESIFPYAGVLGVVAVCLLTLNVIHMFEGVP